MGKKVNKRDTLVTHQQGSNQVAYLSTHETKSLNKTGSLEKCVPTANNISKTAFTPISSNLQTMTLTVEK